jgi:biuret amidohydrolase
VSLLQRAVQPCKNVLDAARQNNLLIIHTREGHRKELSNLHPFKFQRPGAPSDSNVIGRAGPKGRILVQGEPGQDIIPELYPKDGEPIIDKPGKGSFYATDLDCILKAKGIETLIVCGVTTEVCVHTTIREGTIRKNLTLLFVRYVM